MKILDVFAGAYNPVARYMKQDNAYTMGPTSMVMPELIVGIELELEGFPEGVDTLGLFKQEEDGSLRNNGVEAISYPTKAKFVENMLQRFFNANEVTEANYSDRCSTHVHINMQDMTMEQVKSIALLYQTVERLLFHAYIGEDRENNIYCVPWYQAGVTAKAMENFQLNFNGQVRNWIKYTALNLQPLGEKGTIEFRHLRGTCDVKEILNWINLLSSIVKYGANTPYEELSRTIMEMNTISNYEMFLRSVFGEHMGLLVKSEAYQAMLSYGVVDSKMMLVESDKKTYSKETFKINWEMMPAPEAAPDYGDLERALEMYARAYNRIYPQEGQDAAARHAEQQYINNRQLFNAVVNGERARREPPPPVEPIGFDEVAARPVVRPRPPARPARRNRP